MWRFDVAGRKVKMSVIISVSSRRSTCNGEVPQIRPFRNGRDYGSSYSSDYGNDHGSSFQGGIAVMVGSRWGRSCWSVEWK